MNIDLLKGGISNSNERGIGYSSKLIEKLKPRGGRGTMEKDIIPLNPNAPKNSASPSILKRNIQAPTHAYKKILGAHIYIFFPHKDPSLVIKRAPKGPHHPEDKNREQIWESLLHNKKG